MEIKLSLWEDCHEMQKLRNLAEEYAGFRQQELRLTRVDGGIYGNDRGRGTVPLS